MIYSNTFKEYAKLLKQKYKISSTITHKGEKGRQREQGLMEFLKENLPKIYGVATGEIIPYKGAKPSPQCDIIIYDHMNFPILNSNSSVQQVPLEAVYAVIECKSLVDTAALRDSKKKFDAIRALPRCPSETPLRKGSITGPLFTLFGYSLSAKPARCIEFMEDSAKDADVDICILGEGYGVWVIPIKKPIWISDKILQTNEHWTLLIYFVSLLQDLRRIDLGRPSFTKMFFEFEKSGNENH